MRENITSLLKKQCTNADLPNKGIFYRIPNNGLNFIEYRIMDTPHRDPLVGTHKKNMYK